MKLCAPKRALGFTLVELLVALLVFALLASIVYAGLDRMSLTSIALGDRAERFAELQRAVAAIDTDLRQLGSRLGRDREGQLLPALAGAPDRLLARRAGRDNPAGLPRSQLQQLRWGLGPDGLRREVWPDAIADPSDPPSGRTDYPSLRSIEFRYLDSLGRWQNDWPGALPPETLPAAIEYVIESERFGRVRRLVAL